jgi:hypothetical protein
VVEGAELQGRRGLRTAQLSRRGARTNGVHSGTGQPDIILVRGLHRRQRRGASGAVGNESVAGTSFGDISGKYSPAPPPFSHCPNRSRTRFPKRPPFRTAAPSTTTTAKAEKSSLSKKVLSKCAHSVDDGWWKGELEGRVGNFPSLVVEECDEYGEPLTNQWDETPPQSAPPVFTPPDVPNFLVAAEVSLSDCQFQ